ncbi:hypothetical protein TTRE_0000966601 [Trichuris trichiura]|uniref:Uncharacterized protein n=1 Tax=Trichuris trichiura TaxID=36087 RepID=A0A077ZN54_TRITR|nr:hypothetical protein TTRE_0000966601 [Trichuris trichiura]
MVRLVFRPYAQVGRVICTSTPLRTSTRVSSGFVLLMHSSPSFGSVRAPSPLVRPFAAPDAWSGTAATDPAAPLCARHHRRQQR